MIDLLNRVLLVLILVSRFDRQETVSDALAADHQADHRDKPDRG